MGWLDDFNKRKKESPDASLQLKPEDFVAAHTETNNKFLEISEQIKKQGDASAAMLSYIADQKRKEAEAEAARVAAANKKINEDQNKPLDFDNDMEGSLKRLIDPIAINQLKIQARDLRRQTLEEDPEFAEYYTGELKAEVNKILDNEPIQNQQSIELIKNAYKSVVYDYRKKIEEGKIASKFAAANGRSTGTGAPSASKDTNANAELTAEEKQFVRNMGLTEEAFSKSKKELGYV